MVKRKTSHSDLKEQTIHFTKLSWEDFLKQHFLCVWILFWRWEYFLAMSREQSPEVENNVSDNDQMDLSLSGEVHRKERRRLTITATPYASKIRKPRELTEEQFASMYKIYCIYH